MTAECNYSARTHKPNKEAAQTVKSQSQAGDNPLAAGYPGQATPLPPFNVLIKWLSYYHTQTGCWPEPETEAEDGVENIGNIAKHPINNNKSPLIILPSKVQTLKTTRATTGPDITGMEEFNFRSSIYYRAAQALIEKYTAVARAFNETHTLVLSSFLALCNHPAFLTDQTEQSDSISGLNMYLSHGQWSKGLRIRKATLGSYLKELEAAGILEICTPTTAEVTGKSVKRYYRLAVPLEQPLPVFNLSMFSTSSTKEAPSHLESLLRSLSQQNVEPLDKEPEPSIGTFQTEGTSTRSMNMSPESHVSKIIKHQKLTNHEHDSLVEVGTVDVAEKLEFLSQKACFPGYVSAEGLTNLADGEALKFASNPSLNLFTIRKIYEQVLYAWSTGKCTKNPIGFFHYTLTRYLKGKFSTSSTNHQTDSGVSGPDWEPPAGTHKKAGSRFRSIEPSPLAGNCGPIEQTNEQLQNVAGLSTPAPDQDAAVIETCFNRDKPQPDISKIQETLKEQVVEALQDRFRQPALASALGQFNWVVSMSGSKIELRLASRESSFLIATLSQGDVALLKIAASQVLKIHTGGFYEIEVLQDNLVTSSTPM